MNRKITQLAVAAFLAHKPFSLGNTRVNVGETLTTLSLHGNSIATRTRAGHIEITTAGWDTVTTKARLNGIPGVSVCSKNYELMLNGQPWNGSWKAI